MSVKEVKVNGKNDTELKEILIRLLNQQIETVGKLRELVEEAKKEIPDTFCEVYNITTSTTEDTIRCAAIEGKRLTWNWLHLENRDDTNSIRVQLNGDASMGIVLKAGATKTINYEDLRVKYINYQAVAGTPILQVVALRPEAKIEKK